MPTEPGRVLVRIAPPPPKRRPRPCFERLPAGPSLFRLFEPERHRTTGPSFRRFGPLHRFDHHRPGPGDKPALDQERGIWYGAPALTACLIEIFGDRRLIEPRGWHVVEVTTTRDLTLLDLRGACAMRAGTVAALCKTPGVDLPQMWSRHFYEDEAVFDAIDGLIYSNAHNDEDAVAFYERARGALRSRRTLRLDDPSLRPTLFATAHANNLNVTPY